MVITQADEMDQYNHDLAQHLAAVLVQGALGLLHRGRDLAPGVKQDGDQSRGKLADVEVVFGDVSPVFGQVTHRQALPGLQQSRIESIVRSDSLRLGLIVSLPDRLVVGQDPEDVGESLEDVEPPLGDYDPVVDPGGQGAAGLHRGSLLGDLLNAAREDLVRTGQDDVRGVLDQLIQELERVPLDFLVDVREGATEVGRDGLVEGLDVILGNLKQENYIYRNRKLSFLFARDCWLDI